MNQQKLKKQIERESRPCVSNRGDNYDPDNTTRTLKHQRYRSDTRNRTFLAWATMGIIVAWLTVVIIILFSERPLSDAVLITLLGTTTINVIGLAVIVLKGFFERMNQDIDI